MILSGKPAREAILESVRATVQTLERAPKLAVILVGNDPASESYVRSKQKTGTEVGITVEIIRFDADIDGDTVVSKLRELSVDPDTNGIIVQLPLPSHLDSERILKEIPDTKDVDGFSLANMGSLLAPKSAWLESCTPLGILKLLKFYGIDFVGKHMVIVGDGKTVGRPLAALAIREKATVTVCNRFTKDVANHTRMADIVVAAVGKPHLITADMVKEWAVVIDVGINRVDGKIVGDADFEEITKKASCSPVPGWVGLMTVAVLLENTLKATMMQRSGK